MNIEVSSVVAASVWEALCASSVPVDAQALSRETGIPMARVSSILGKFNVSGLVQRQQVVVDTAQVPEEMAVAAGRGRGASKRAREQAPVSGPVALVCFSPCRSMDAMTYATAVEIGVPLNLLEKTVSLSKQMRREAFKLAESGEVDAALERSKERRRQEVEDQVRGRAATRAAATDLAKLVQDVSKVVPVAVPLNEEIKRALPENAVMSPMMELRETPALAKVRMEVARQAASALESLVLAMERVR